MDDAGAVLGASTGAGVVRTGSVGFGGVPVWPGEEWVASEVTPVTSDGAVAVDVSGGTAA
jgi:hypothetical protein